MASDSPKQPDSNSPPVDRHKRRTLGFLAAAGAAPVAPYVFARTKTKLRVLGTHVTLQEAIRKQAQQDLDIDLVFEPGGSAAVLQKASVAPESFDLYEQWSNSIRVLWQSGSIQPIDKQRIRYWSEVNDLTKTGTLLPGATLGAGDAPHKILHVQPDGTLDEPHTNKLSFLPYVHNVDSFGYNSRFIDLGEPYKTESWGWMLKPEYKGKVAVVNAPTIGLFDLALAAQAQGQVTFEDIGNISHTEMNNLFAVLIDLKRSGHFSGFWTSVPESVSFMSSNRVSIQSMFSPAVSELNGRNIPVVYAAPKEGYRGWHGVMCLSSATRGRQVDAAYEYMNWWLSGWPGAHIARQGYYISNPERTKSHLSQAEWDYWYAGAPAAQNLKGVNGQIVVRQGDVRRGGSYETRFSNVAVWNTVMHSYDYSLEKWYEFISA